MRASCGDGYLWIKQNGTEECDDNNTINVDECLNTCENAECGDGVTRTEGDNPEECDDANKVETDECLNNCKDSRCGDGKVEEGVE